MTFRPHSRMTDKEAKLGMISVMPLDEAVGFRRCLRDAKNPLADDEKVVDAIHARIKALTGMKGPAG